ncbi:MAG: hypothetical protein CR997_00665 [Acidobacteria bacterium]|nr:MAG: hypothetical protein CR997_00665 [Acidobacteriota bacterium]
MKKTLILVPSLFEYEHLFPHSNQVSVWEKRGVFPRVCGVGPAVSSFMTGHLLRELKPDHILLCGLAGAFKQSHLDMGTVVSVSREVLADTGYSERGFPVTFDEIEMPLFKPAESRAMTCSYDLKPIPGFQVVSSITVSNVTSDHRIAQFYYQKYQCGIENMEGGGAAIACHFYSKPLEELRAVSNYVGPRDKESWQMLPALKRLREALNELWEVENQ